MGKMIKVSDWMVNYLINIGVSDVFGYPGGMAVHFMDSLSKNNKIQSHITYNEQGAAFAACGYAQVRNNVGVAFSSSGPGFTNMITGITNAFFDSIPLIVITFNVNTYESSRNLKVMQKGFQEMDVVSVAKHITKKSFYVESKESIVAILKEAYTIAMEGRRGPVLIDVPMDISREYIEDICDYPIVIDKDNSVSNIDELLDLINNSKRPCLILGNGIKNINKDKVRQMINILKIPVVTSMPSVDLIESNNPFNYGFLGAYGNRTSNFVVAKSDLIISIGSRLDVRQISTNPLNFAPSAKLIRFDIDENELSNKIKKDEVQFKVNSQYVVDYIINQQKNIKDFNSWNYVCMMIKKKLAGYDNEPGNQFIYNISKKIKDDVIITADVGQNQVWIAQSFFVKSDQKILFSGNFGSMGYSLPASIGAYYASKTNVYCFNGDGGIQMNIQELQFINRERLPIKIFILNNHSLGMIRNFQEMYMEANYTLTTNAGGYTVPNFKQLAKAYNLKYCKLTDLKQIDDLNLDSNEPEIIEIILPDKTYVFPKLAMKKPNQDQEPLLDRNLYDYLMEL